MRQVFTSPRLENVEGVAKLLTDAGIQIKVSDDRGYKQVSRREFSYVQKARDGGNQPAIWVIKSDDYKRARELLHDAGLADSAQAASYVPEAMQFKQSAKPDPQQRLMRIKLTLLFVAGGVVAWMILRMIFQP
ncbi:MAG: pathogenicity-like protein [Arenimonas sp.]|nr:pathogenicity-like protein [Arenimonas sp.]